MKSLWLSLLLLVFVILGLSSPAQDVEESPAQGSSRHEVRLPNGRLQKDEIVKADHAQNVDDAEALAKLAEELKTELAKSTEFVLSVSAIKKTEEIERLARRIRSRMKRY